MNSKERATASRKSREKTPEKEFFNSASMEKFNVKAIAEELKPWLESGFRNFVQQTSRSKSPSDRIPVPTRRGYDFVTTKEIVYLRANGSYTDLKLKSGDLVVLSKNMGSVLENLCPTCFVRPNRSWALNRNEILTLYTDVKKLLVSDGTHVPIAKKKLCEIKKSLGIQ